MALNFQTLKTRAITALIFVLVMLTGLLWNSWSFLILVSIIHFGCWIEFLQLTEKIHAVQMDTVEKYFLAVGGYMLVLLFGVRHYSFDTGKSVAGIHLSFKLLLCAFVLLALFFFFCRTNGLPTRPNGWWVAGLCTFPYRSRPFFISVTIPCNSCPMGVLQNWAGSSPADWYSLSGSMIPWLTWWAR